MKIKVFEIFECPGQILSNSLCQFWNNKLIPLQILCLSSALWNIISLFFFSSKKIYFARWEHIKVKFFKTFECSGQIFQISDANFEGTSRFLSKFCISLQFQETLFIWVFLLQPVYTLLDRSPLKWNFLRLWSARVKFCQIPYNNFETTSWFLSKFCVSLQLHERLFLCTFFSSNKIYFLQ